MKRAAVLLYAIACSLTALYSAEAKTFVVNGLGDASDANPGDGVCGNSFNICTLRAAIQEANAFAGADTITFNLGSGTPVITLPPDSPLPFITTPVTINGATGGATRIRLQGSYSVSYGLVVGTGSDGSLINSLGIQGFGVDGLVVANNVTVQNCYVGTSGATADEGNTNDGIRVDGNNNVIGGTTAGTGNVISGNGHYGVHLILSASGNQIQGNLVGTLPSGGVAKGNGSGGIFLEYASGNAITNNTIGGTSAAARNIISGNNGNGITISGSGATANNIQGNYIGTDFNGTARLGNASHGVAVKFAGTNNKIGGASAGTRNIISANKDTGVFLQESPGTKVQGNYIGTDVTGAAALGNANGVKALSPDDIIGGSASGAGNVISGNSARGLVLGERASRNTIQGNLIGTDSSGTKRLGNAISGITFRYDVEAVGGTNNTIGGGTAGAGNVISANGGNGVEIDSRFSDNVLAGNLIGTDFNGTANLGNTGHGIFIASSRNAVGGAGLQNTIAFNANNGITIFGGNNRISSNSIFSNGSLGIDLNNDGVTANDAGDSDTGPNNLQNFPVLTSATYDPSSNSTVVQGTLNSAPGASFTIEFFASSIADQTLYGEGQTFRGSTSVTTNAIGDVGFTVTLDAPVSGGQVITATATDATNNTSEFSKAVLVAGPSGPTPTPTPTATPTPTPAAQLLNLSTRKQVGTGDNVTIGGFIIVGTEPKKVILRGIGPSLPVSGALADPTLELHDASGTLSSNNDWQDTQRDEIIATGVPPSNNLESAIVAMLPAAPASQGGAPYSGVLAGRAGSTGIGVLELYDLDTAANSKLANISTRGFVGGGDDVVIGGFIPGPSDRASLKVLIRGLGPSIPVNGALQDPVLELHDGNGNTLVLNDDWQQASNASEIAATGIPPSNAKESAILTTVPPSNSGYTAVLRGVNGGTGIGLVELYTLQ